MTPAERDVAHGLVGTPAVEGRPRTGWREDTDEAHACVWTWAGVWYTEADMTARHATEDAALTAYLDAVGAP